MIPSIRAAVDAMIRDGDSLLQDVANQAVEVIGPAPERRRSCEEDVLVVVWAIRHSGAEARPTPATIRADLTEFLEALQKAQAALRRLPPGELCLVTSCSAVDLAPIRESHPHLRELSEGGRFALEALGEPRAARGPNPVALEAANWAIQLLSEWRPGEPLTGTGRFRDLTEKLAQAATGHEQVSVERVCRDLAKAHRSSTGRTAG